jgi:hypothetical protein
LYPVNAIKCVSLFLKCRNFLLLRCRAIRFKLLNITICLQRHLVAFLYYFSFTAVFLKNCSV